MTFFIHSSIDRHSGDPCMDLVDNVPINQGVQVSEAGERGWGEIGGYKVTVR